MKKMRHFGQQGAWIAVISSVLLFPGAALAAAPGSHPRQAKATPTRQQKKPMDSTICRYCGMKMSSMKTEGSPRLRHIHGKAYYCCVMCGPHQLTGEMTQAMAKTCKAGGHMAMGH